MTIVDYIWLLLILLLVVLILYWIYDSFEYSEIPICNNIYELLDYHYKYLINSYKIINNIEKSELLEKNLKTKPSEDLYVIAENLDLIAECYYDLGKKVSARDIYLHAFKLRRWYLPKYHKDTEKTINDLINIFSELYETRKARYMFEQLLENKQYVNFLSIEKYKEKKDIIETKRDLNKKLD